MKVTEGRALTAILLLALGLRLAIVLAVPGSQLHPSWQASLTDANAYVEIAQNVAEGRGYVEGENLRAYRPPGYPLLLAGVFLIFGSEEFLVPRLLNVGAGVGLVIVASLLARRLFGSSLAGLTAALCVALYPMFVYFTPFLLTETMFSLLLAGAVFFAIRWAQSSGLGNMAAAGVLVGLACLTRPSALLFVFCSCVWVLVLSLKRRSSKPVLAYVIPCLLVVLPWSVRNYIIFDQVVPIATNGPMNVVAGLTSKYLDTIGIEALPEADSLLVRPSSIEFLSEAERADYDMQRAMDFMVQHPGYTLQLLVVKASRLWTPFPDHHGAGATVISLLTYFPALVLGLVGLAYLLRTGRRNEAVLIALVFVSFTAVHALTIAKIRFRFPSVDPLLLVLTAGVVARMISSRSPWMRSTPTRLKLAKQGGLMPTRAAPRVRSRAGTYRASSPRTLGPASTGSSP